MRVRKLNRMKIMTKRNTKGFTLAELLIVVAIIAVLVAISVPIFTSQLKKARLAVDHAAIRDAYALVQVANNTESVVADGVTYTFAELRVQGKCTFLLSSDCNSLIKSQGNVTEFTKAYLQKEDGSGDREACDICLSIGQNIASEDMAYLHKKYVPIYMFYSDTDNMMHLGSGNYNPNGN